MVFFPNIEHDEHEMEWQCTSHFPKKNLNTTTCPWWRSVVTCSLCCYLQIFFFFCLSQSCLLGSEVLDSKNIIIIKQYSLKQHKVSDKGNLRILSITFTSIMVSIEAKYLDHQSNMLSSGSSSSISSPFFFFFFFFSLSFSSSFCRCRWCRDAYIILNVVA